MLRIALPKGRLFDETLDLFLKKGIIKERFEEGRKLSIRLDNFEFLLVKPFYPDRVAQRILGLGDIQTLVEKVQQVIPEDEAQALAFKVLKGDFDLEDMLKQIRFIKNMGPLDKLLGMLPGIGAQLKGLKIDEKKFKKTEAIILSMTKQERRNPKIINLSRKQRIAKGSGTTVSDVNKVLKEYEEMKKMIKKLKGMQGIPQLPKFPFPFKR